MNTVEFQMILTSFFFVVDNAFMKKYSPLKLRNLEELQEF